MNINLRNLVQKKHASTEDYENFLDEQHEKLLNSPSVESSAVGGGIAMLIGAVVALIAHVISRYVGKKGQLTDSIQSFKETDTSPKPKPDTATLDELSKNTKLQRLLSTPVVRVGFVKDHQQKAWLTLLEWTDYTASMIMNDLLFSGKLAKITNTLDQKYDESVGDVLRKSSALLGDIAKTGLVDDLPDNATVEETLAHIQSFCTAMGQAEVGDEAETEKTVRKTLEETVFGRGVFAVNYRTMEQISANVLPDSLLANAKKLEELKESLTDDMEPALKSQLKAVIALVGKVEKIHAQVIGLSDKSFRGADEVMAITAK